MFAQIRALGPSNVKLKFLPGIVGPANKLSIGTVTTGDPGSDAEASITGTPPNQRLDFVIPRGDKGDKGDKGDTGNTGNTGATGPQSWQTPPVAWAASTPYTATAPASVVIYQGETYVCKTSHTSSASFDASKFTKIAAKGADGTGLTDGDKGDIIVSGAGASFKLAIPRFKTRALAAAATIPASADGLITDGYSAWGDGGGARYKRVGAGPASLSRFQSGDGAWWDLVPEGGIYNVRQFGAKGDGVTFDNVAINAAIQVANAAGGGVVYCPGVFGTTYLIDEGLNLTGCSNVTLRGPSGWLVTIKATASLNASNNSTKNDLIYALNFTGSAPYAQSNIIVEDLVLDCTNQNISGLPGGAQYGYSLAGVEIMNVDYARVRRCKIIKAYGNGAVISTQDPRQFAPSLNAVSVAAGGSGYAVGDLIDLTGGTPNPAARLRVTSVSGGAVTGLTIENRGTYYNPTPSSPVATTKATGSGSGLTVNATFVTVQNGILDPRIDDNVFVDCVRGTLPQYASSLAPQGICGDCWQVGAAYGGSVSNNLAIRPGGPFGDFFACTNLSVDDNVVYDIGSTAVGASPTRGSEYQQTVGDIRSDFGAFGCSISRNKFYGTGGIRLAGSMTKTFQTGQESVPGPIGCTIEGNWLYQTYGRLQVAPLAMPASGGTITNPYTQVLEVTIIGGTGVTATIQRGGTGSFDPAIMSPSGSVALMRGDVLKLVYTTAPTWAWYLAPNLLHPAISIVSGSAASLPAQARSNTISDNIIIEPGTDGIQVFDFSRNILSGNYIQNVGKVVPSAGYALYTSIQQSGGGSSDNKITGGHVVDTRTPRYMVSHYKDDSATYCLRNEFNNVSGDPTTGKTVDMQSLTGSVTGWQNYTPTVSSSGGALSSVTSVSGSFADDSNSRERRFTVKATISNIGTGSGGIVISLPSTPVGDYLTLTGRDLVNSGKLLQGYISGSNVIVQNYDSSFPAVNGSVINISGSYRRV